MSVSVLLAAGTLLAAEAPSVAQQAAPRREEYPALRYCAGGAVVRAEDTCPVLLHSSRIDQGIRPALHIVLSCAAPPARETERIVEEGLFAAGYDVVNHRRLREELGEGPEPHLTIYAVGTRSMVWVRGSPTSHRAGEPYRISLSLLQLPLAKEPRVERALRRLAGRLEAGACRTVKIERQDNDLASSWTYEDLESLVRHYLSQARQTADSRAYKVHR